jgi:hypothetical protein
MADEKPKEPTIWDFLKLSRPKTVGAGTKILMEDPKTPAQRLERLDELLKLLRDKPGFEGLGSHAIGQSDPDYARLIKWFAEVGEREAKEAAQKKAAETNLVDEGLANLWLNEHWKDRNCAICRVVTWAMAPQFAHISFARPGAVGAPPSFPCVVLTCRNCGNTLFFNAVAMKLLPEGAQ